MAVNDVETCSCDIILVVSGETKEIVNVTCILLVTSGYTHEPGTSTTDHMRRICAVIMLILLMRYVLTSRGFQLLKVSLKR
jgi:hypothetical protein